MPKKSGQKFKYLENEKSFYDEIKSIFHNFEGLSLKQIKFFFLEGESPTLTKKSVRKLVKKQQEKQKQELYLCRDR